MNSLLIAKVTILITRHYEHRLIVELLKYYRSHNSPVRILVLDSSDRPIDTHQGLGSNDQCNVQYEVYDYTIGMFEKILLGLEKVTTPYTVICSDDDFITLNGILESVDFLESNRDYSVSHGHYISFRTKTDKHGELTFHLDGVQEYDSIADESPIERFKKHFMKYEMPTYSAVHRTKLLMSVLRETIAYTDDYRFGELLPSLLTLLNGKMKHLDVFYAARRWDPNSSGQTLMTFDGYVATGSYDKKYARFSECLSKHIKESCRIDQSEAERIIKEGMNGYLNYSGPRRFMKVRSSVKGLLAKFNVLKSTSRSIWKFFKRLSGRQSNSARVVDSIIKDGDFALIRTIVVENKTI